MTVWKRIAARLLAHWGAPNYLITAEADWLRAELVNHESLRQMRDFLHTVFRASVDNMRSRVLIYVRSPKPLHLVGCVNVFPEAKGVAWYRSNKIAIVGSSANIDFPRNDIQTRARQRGINLSFFSNEAAALRWFHDRRKGPRRVRERNYGHSEVASLRRAIEDQRQRQDRRQAPRHIVPGGLQLGV
jgi:hypothetical protein